MLEIDENLFVPICIAVISGIVAIGAVTYSKIRSHIRVTVNCWFCNENSRVPLPSRNCFVCPSCSQYNGFAKDGDYNRDIPAQRMESLNFTNTGRKSSSSKLKSPTNNGLCHTCNINQCLKVKSLAEFQPFMEDNYDAELETYRQRLDTMFSLCRNCEGVLHQTLGKQNSWLKPILMTYRLEQSRKHIYEVLASAKDTSLVSFAAKIFLVLTSLLMALSTLYKSALPDEYLLLQLAPGLSEVYSFGRRHLPMTCFLSICVSTGWLVSHGRKFICAIDYCCLLLWAMVWGISSDSFSLEKYFSWSLQALSIFTFVATVVSVSKKRAIATWKNKAVNRLKLNEHDLSVYSDSDTNGSLISEGSFAPEPEIKADDTRSLKSTLTPEGLQQLNVPCVSEYSSDKSDLGSSFGGLKIGTPQKSSPKSFSARSLFSEKSHPILAEPKLFSKVTQASWVAGGYWGTSGSPQRPRVNARELLERKIPPFSLSRSSSHSSGFVSRDSGAGTLNSGPDSLYGDTDRCSQLSDPASLYPRSFPPHNQEPFVGVSRAPTVCGTYSQCNFPSRRSSPLNKTTSFTNFAPLNASGVETTVVASDLKMDLMGKYSPTVVAFILGISVTANFFLFFNNGNIK